jgi:hypothetical protein
MPETSGSRSVRLEEKKGEDGATRRPAAAVGIGSFTG